MALAVTIDTIRLEDAPEAAEDDSVDTPETAQDAAAIELVINRDFSGYTEEEQAKLLAAIGELLNISGDIRVITRRPGSVKLTLKLTPEQAEKLYWAVERGELEAFGVVGARLLPSEWDRSEAPIGSDLSEDPIHFRIDDRALLQRCLNHKSVAWKDFVDRFIGLIYHTILYTADMREFPLRLEDIEDLAAEILLQIVAEDFAILRQFQGNSSLATYLAVIARRICVHELAQREKALKALLPHGEASPTDPAIENPLAKLPGREPVVSLAPKANPLDTARPPAPTRRQISAGDDQAVQPHWEWFFPQLIALAHKKLADNPKRVADEEDVALNAFASLRHNAERGLFPQLLTHGSLWRLLVFITARKAAHLLRGWGEWLWLGGYAEVVPGECQLLEQVLSSTAPEFAAFAAEECERLLEQLGDEKLRQIALWRMEDCSVEEIASRLGCTDREVKRKLNQIWELWSGSDVT
jgi:RNA polymerase sigma factor (sigma-70 family)